MVRSNLVLQDVWSSKGEPGGKGWKVERSDLVL